MDGLYASSGVSLFMMMEIVNMAIVSSGEDLMVLCRQHEAKQEFQVYKI